MIRFGQGQNDERKKMKYAVVVKANINTVWEADSKEQALRQAEAWTAEEYGNLVDKANYEVRELS